MKHPDGIENLADFFRQWAAESDAAELAASDPAKVAPCPVAAWKAAGEAAVAAARAEADEERERAAL